jgi:acyl-coenzyme A thioesterase PaaI-like protein
MADDPPAASPPPPPGFVHVLRAPFVNHVGPLLQRDENPHGRMTLGLWVELVHTNTMGFMHGGMIATVCDSAMARSTHGTLQRRTVTLRMNMEYFDPVLKGDWMEAHGRLVDHDEDVAHTECLIMVGGQMRARSTGVFRLLRKV